MITTIRRWTDKGRKKWWPILEALSGAEDPRGDELRRLEGRIRHLEAEVTALRLPSGPAAAEAVRGE